MVKFRAYSRQNSCDIRKFSLKLDSIENSEEITCLSGHQPRMKKTKAH